MSLDELVEVVWMDSLVPRQIWMNKEELGEWVESSDPLIQDVGWIMGETDDHLVLAARVADDQYGGIIQIPRGCIIEINNLGHTEEE